MSEELARIPEQGAVIVAEALAQASEQRRLLGEYVAKHMIKDTDYGVIPGTQKPTLLKPGAEKLTALFRCTAQFNLEHKVEDWDKNLFLYHYQCRIISLDTGNTLAEGVGSANSRESKWRYRNADRVCPHCKKSAIIKGREEFGGGWICFKKKGGCGAKFGETDQAITGQPQGQIENEDVASLINTIVKIAKKRAHVDAAISLARCSDVFTQDMEPGHVESHQVESRNAEESAGMRLGWPSAHAPRREPDPKPAPLAHSFNPQDEVILRGWREWFDDERPHIARVNECIHELKGYKTPELQKAAWAIITKYAEKSGWFFDRATKSFNTILQGTE